MTAYSPVGGARPAEADRLSPPPTPSGGSLLAQILPPQAHGVEAYHDAPAGSLYPEEAALLARSGAGDKRRREFTTVRACARAALHELGVPPAPVLPGPGRAPNWPAGVTGSMTHCDGYRAAAVAATADLRSLGIDAEPAGPLPAGVLGLIGSRAERAQVAHLARERPEVPWDRLLFCAKEAAYKAWYPVTGQWVALADIAVEVGPEDGRLRARPPGGGALRELPGRWAVAGQRDRAGLLLVAVTVRV
ncbi:4'-phosphopantetheinyl transferase superfamily protein [Natronosporangium hydrolyticum]|uniref:4'-phosphopantetheinyl transferase superfamily protein n=1 Tax=Natronosporangium hydrolyticum TaxID=2811111 RepID=A0A895YLE6_9ACTN|nr:4'-phosphopantetheinyl transferase superfamily protein [Natronosporangium hydrolyticum]QSB16795.1 4'-phosphopantetheinyl transferase superfamily protein [Natronosporangium hydrolyticum]